MKKFINIMAVLISVFTLSACIPDDGGGGDANGFYILKEHAKFMPNDRVVIKNNELSPVYIVIDPWHNCSVWNCLHTKTKYEESFHMVQVLYFVGANNKKVKITIPQDKLEKVNK